MCRVTFLVLISLSLLALNSSAAENTETSETAVQEKVERQEKEPITFYVSQYRVKGNTVLNQSAIETVLYAFTGPNKTIQDLDEARKTLENTYKDKGYPAVLVVLPEQDLLEGIVYLEVVESKIEWVSVSGSRYYSLSKLRSEIPAVAEGKTLYLPEFQAQMNKVNRSSVDRSVTPLMKPGFNPGTMRVDMRVKDSLPLHGNLILNNSHSASTEEQRSIVDMSYGNLWQEYHNLNLQYQTSPEDTDQIQVAIASYLMPLKGNNKLASYVVHSNSDVTVFSGDSAIGKGTIFGLRGIFPLSSSANYFHSVTVGYDYKDYEDVLRAEGSDSGLNAINYSDFSITYSGTKLWQDITIGIGAGMNFGVRGLPNTTDEFNLKRYNAKPNYFSSSLSFDLNYNMPFGFETLIEAQSQLTNQELISNEQFSVGGETSVRGYFESQVLGDRGFFLRSSLIFPNIFSSFKSRPAWLSDLRILGFYDVGKVNMLGVLVPDPLNEELNIAVDQWEQLEGAGVGLTMQLSSHFDMGIYRAQALKSNGNQFIDEDAGTANPGYVEEGAYKTHFNVSLSF